MNRHFATRLSDVIEALESGSRPKGGASKTSGEIPSLGAEHLDGAGGFLLDEPKLIPQAHYDRMPAGRIRTQDILIVKDGATTGKVSFVDTAFPFQHAAINEHVFRLAIDATKADAKYVFWYLASQTGQQQVMSDFRGATVGGIGRTFIDKVQLPLPPLDEQRRIAAILDKAAALRQKRTRAIALLDSLTQSIFLEMFGKVKADWPIMKIDQVGKNIRTGPFGSQLLHSEFVDEGIAVLGIDNVVQNTFAWGKPRFITNEKYRALSRYKVHAGDVLITIMGTIGRCVVVPEDVGDAINTKHLCCITPDKNFVLPEYLRACFLEHPEVLRQLGQRSKGAIMDGLNMGIIRGLAIPVPPITDQQKFARMITAVSEQLQAAKTGLSSADSLFASLQHRAFSGQL